jgi:hypothetical protein
MSFRSKKNEAIALNRPAKLGAIIKNFRFKVF